MNAAKANLFLVMAKTRTSDRLGDFRDAMTMFLVDGSSPDIKIHEKVKTIGYPNLYQSKVTFKRICVSCGKIISLIYFIDFP